MTTDKQIEKLKARLKREEEAFKKKIGRRLKALRVAHGLSMGELAELAGVNRGNIGKIEAGQNSPTYIIMFRLSRALRTDLEYFV